MTEGGLLSRPVDHRLTTVVMFVHIAFLFLIALLPRCHFVDACVSRKSMFLHACALLYCVSFYCTAQHLCTCAILLSAVVTGIFMYKFISIYSFIPPKSA